MTFVVAATAAGCTSLKRSDTARTGREQLLLSNAIDQSLSKVDFEAFRNRAVFVEDKYLDCVDKGYVTASIRHRIAQVGGTLAAKADAAEIVLELRSGGVGTDFADSYLGTPAITLPGMASIPEIKLVSRSHQSGTAKIGMAAYDAKTMQLLGDGGVSLSQSHDNNWSVMGVGPYQDGSVRHELAQSTGRRPGQPWREISTQVAFQPAAPDTGKVRYAQDERQQGWRPPTATQASGEAPATPAR